MKVQTKILLLLLVVCALFGGGLAALRLRERAKFRRIALENAQERESFFNEFLAHRGESLQMLAKDDTYSDDLVRAIGANDVAWARENINESTLTAFNADVIWVCHADQSGCYSLNRLDVPKTTLSSSPCPPRRSTPCRTSGSCTSS